MYPAPALPLALSGNATIVVIAVGLLILLVLSLFVFKYFQLWLQCVTTNAGIGFVDLIGMSFRKINPRIIVQSKIAAVQAGIGMETRDLEAHYLAGGHVPHVVKALIAADRANLPLDFRVATGIDLAGRDILDAVNMYVKPRVINCPDPTVSGTEYLDAVAMDGIRMIVKARVTVRADLGRLVGGATEETIIARVGQGIVSAIGSADTYKEVLRNPDNISKVVLDGGLDAQTAFEIVSIDIADVSVAGIKDAANVGALLEAERAETDKKMRQAEAEGRRAMAVAQEQEMKALLEENRAKVVEAEAQIPQAISEAFRSGNLGVMDYYNLRNIQSDTEMRNSISGRRGAEEEPRGDTEQN
ncbi:MAG: flotillin-like protein FloA [Planctomycetota bacterium]